MSFNSDPLLISERAIGQLQNNSNNGAMLITINHVIHYVNNQPGAQPEIFQVRGCFVKLGHFGKHFLKKFKKKKPHRRKFRSFFSSILLKLHSEW